MVHLVRPDARMLGAARDGDEALASALGHAVVPGWATFRGALQSARGSAWGTRFLVTGDPPELVGWGGFKGAPRRGVVELGYEIAESHRGRGLATAAARAMLVEAFANPRVIAVIAHTMPEQSASTRVLEKAGFRREAQVEQAGTTVWRFRIERGEERR